MCGKGSQSLSQVCVPGMKLIRQLVPGFPMQEVRSMELHLKGQLAAGKVTLFAKPLALLFAPVAPHTVA